VIVTLTRIGEWDYLCYKDEDVENGDNKKPGQNLRTVRVLVKIAGKA
jgi:hypothetical protein